MPTTYSIKEMVIQAGCPDYMPAVLDDGSGGFIHALVKRVPSKYCSEEDIARVFRTTRPSDIYPPVLGSDNIPVSVDGLFLKTIRLVSYNPWKFNPLFSVRREIESLSVIRHPNIVRYHGVFVEDGLIKGLYLDQYDFTLDHMLQTGVEFDRMKFFKHLVVAVDYIRELGFVHGDIHVENVMVKKEDTSFPYLIDFDACEKVGTKIIETTKTFGEKRSDIITYGCDSSLLIDVFETLFLQ